MMPLSKPLIFIAAGILVILGIIGMYVFSANNASSPYQNMDTTPSGFLTQSSASGEQKPASAAVPGEQSARKSAGHLITLTTTLGQIQFKTHDADAPKTVQNFITLAQKGFYDNLTFHRVIKGFMIQGGDPNGTGTGGPGYTFADELNPATASYREGYTKGAVAMANAGPNTNGSQFFIMLENTPLPHSYTIFGRVTKGQDVVDAIGSVRTGANDRPVQPVIIQSAKVEEVFP